jgi:hypothetical protein
MRWLELRRDPPVLERLAFLELIIFTEPLMVRLAFPVRPWRLCLVLGLGIILSGICGIAVAQQRQTQPKRTSPGDSKTAAGDPARALDGAWRLVKSLDPRSGQLREVPSGIEMTKLVVGGRYGWIVSRNGQVLAGAGGTYNFAPNAYSETVTYAVGQNQQPLIGTTTRFTWRLEGNTWYHKGTIRVGQAKQEIDEVWERVP